MTQFRKVSLPVLVASFLAAGGAFAQDPTPADEKKPNILIIVDTSGSMEYETGNSNYPTCYPDEADPANHTKSRWIDVLEVLTGTISNYACAAEDRSSSDFIDEFSMPDGEDPPDANYRNPYHRPLSNGCAITADRSTSLTNAFDWAPPLQAEYPVNPSSLTACTSAFTQAGNGFIDTYNDVARFGLMTYDPLPDPETGHAGASTYGPQYSNGVTGTWSYYSGTPAQGKPADCASLQTLEVGARNGAAPATEGKMIYFGNQDLSTLRDQARHDRLQQVLLGTRPYGATPINGILDDARNFFWYDASVEPTGETAAPGDTLYGTAGDGMLLSPRFDEYVECGCRDQHIILITDGEPNLDLRPHCEQLGTFGDDGVCPYPDDPAEILADLSGGSTTDLPCSPSTAGNNQYQIITHVVGYSTETYNSGANDCEDLRTDDPNWDQPGGSCDAPTDPDLQVCCELHELAAAGSDDGSGTPYIAPSGAALQASLGSIMASLLRASASGTRPVRSPGIGAADTSQVAFRLLTSYSLDSGGGLWEGKMERMRWTCDASGVPTEQPRDEARGDDFAHNVGLNKSDREFITYIPALLGGQYRADETIRPNMDLQDDGASNRAGTVAHGGHTSFVSNVPAAALEIDYLSDAACTSTSAPDNDTCRTQILDWTLGYDDGVGNDRCPNPADCSVLGDIMHSTPTIVNRPSASIEDDTYTTYRDNNVGRMMMAYVSTNDGQLHGFAVSPNQGTEMVDDDSENNEYFSFIPPAVLPRLKGQYPGNRNKLLDGVAVVEDVVATEITDPYYRYKLERDTTDPADQTWRTVMVQAFGGPQPGYFALDITDARRPSAGGGTGGPTFLWQLTTSDTPNTLFGTGGTPIITTIDLNGTETAVAVLPGGAGGSPLGGSCPRSNPDIGSTFDNTHYDATVTTAAFEPRTAVNCYSPADQAARSLTIVRLDSGQILRRFIRDNTDPNDTRGLDSSVFADNPTPGNPFLDSPITGTPAAYPSGTGLVADRIFVGDQDGTMWRVDVSNDDPGQWTMQLFFDSYGPDGAGDGKPIITPPMLSVDNQGQITIAYGTGDQDLSGGSGDIQYLYSLTEVEDTTSGEFVAKVNWYSRLEDGPHILGPMSLLGGALYFTTVDPTSSNVCTQAPAQIWGVDYIQPEDPSDISAGGKARLQVAGSTDIEQNESATDLVSDALGSSGGDVGAVFGVSLEYIPTCSTTGTASNEIGAGSRTTISDVSQSQLQLVFQTGTVNTSQGGLNFETGFEAIALEPPRSASTIMSWASILE